MRTYEIWSRWTATNEGRHRPAHLGTIQAESFGAAIEQLIAGSPPEDRRLYRYNPDTGTWFYWGCELFEDRDQAYKGWKPWWT